MSRKNRLFAKLASTVNGNGRLKSNGFASTVELGGGGVTAYATPSDLPLTGNEAGDQAFVSSTNRLYIFNGSGWFNIALVNTSPTITTGAETNYQLQKNGIPIVITLAATDPEETPIIWSYAVTSGAVGNTATINQVDNVFTITPSTDENDGGEFTLTFTASDGVNVDTSTSAFSLSFSWELDVTELDGNRITNAAYNRRFKAYGVTMASNGIDMYVAGGGDYPNRITQWRSVNDQILDHTYGYGAILTGERANNTKLDCHISNDGVYFYVYINADEWQRYTLSTPFIISSLDESTRVYGATQNYGDEHQIHAFTISDNGLKMYTLKDYDPHKIIEYTLPSAHEIGVGTATRVAAYNLPAPSGNRGYRGIAIDPTGRNIYISNMANSSPFTFHIIQYHLSTPYSIATASEVGRKTYTGHNPWGSNYSSSMAINAGNITVISENDNRIYQFT